MGKTRAIISLEALRHNLNQIRSRLAPHVKILAMVKANAYGHGLVECARVLRTEGVAALGVAFIEEAMELRKAGDRGRIIVLTPPFPEEAELYAAYQVECIISSEEIFRSFAEYTQETQHSIVAHIFIDTGMHREGISEDKVPKILKLSDDYPHLHITGICTHFATAETDKYGVYEQLARFTRILRKCQDFGYHFPDIHAANSAAIADIPESHFTMVRPGIALYGYNASPFIERPFSLIPVLELETAISEVRTVAEGEWISYGRTYRVSETTTIGTLPIGYGHGYPRILGNRASCIIQGKLFPIVGTICMDECMVNLSGQQFPIGQKVTLIGKSARCCITAEHLAQWANTIPYEILTNLNARIDRVYIDSKRREEKHRTEILKTS